MSVVINSNYAATSAANNLAVSSHHLQRSLNRLSSGSKIVNPSDDAGGLAVSMKLSAAARRQGAVATNIANEVSFLQTQDGVLNATGRILSRIGELKVLHSDITKSVSDRANYQAEFAALQAQITANGGEKFNGVSLFGTTGQTVITTEDGGNSVTAAGVNLLGTSTPPAWTDVSGVTPGADWTSSSPGISNGFGETAFHADGTLTTTQSDIAGPYAISFSFDSYSFGAGNMTIGGGGGGSLDLLSLGNLMGSTHTMDITVDASGNASWSLDSGAQTGNVANFGAVGGGAVVFTRAGGADFHIKDDFALNSTGGGGSGDIASVIGAASLSGLSLSAIAGAIEDVATFRAENGANQSRFGFAAELLTVNKANLEAANSRITDVDVARESTSLARYNILVQAGTSMLAQANQTTQSVLKLIS